MLKGSCCCGAVRFTVASTPSMMGTCHCSRCRKVGAATFAFVKRADFKLVQGQENIAIYEPEPDYKYARCFCNKCGTALGEILSEEDSFPVAANCFDDVLSIENRFHEFVAEKPDWLVIGDKAPRFDGHPES